MATSFDVIEDRALATIDDYSLVKLYSQSIPNFQTFCDGLLISAVPLFTQCQQALTYDATTRTFDSDFTNLEISILAGFWQQRWWERYVQTASQFQAKLQSNSFKNFSEAQNLKEKRVSVDEVRERVYQLITDYQLQDIDTLY